jgi:hypothetical protein
MALLLPTVDGSRVRRIGAGRMGSVPYFPAAICEA